MAYRPSDISIGEFQEAEVGNWFTYSKAPKTSWGFQHNLEYVIDVGEDEYRFANIKKTVAYVCIDEDEFGNPVLEKWNLKKHNMFNRN